MNCTVEGCRKREKARGLCSMHYARRQRGADLLAPNKAALSYDELFDLHLSAPTASGCVEWTAGRDQDGYGLFTGKGRKTIRAHRYAYERAHGRADGLVCHHCDNPSCVEISHLFLGAPRDNSADMVRKGRSLTGGANPNASLTDAQAERIRGSDERPSALAQAHGVSLSSIYKVRRGHSFAARTTEEA